MTRPKQLFLIAALLYILYELFPLFADITRIPVWLPSIGVSVIIACLYPKAFANKTFLWFIGYALILALYLLVGHSLSIGIGSIADSKKILVEFSFILPTISIFITLRYLNDLELVRKLMIWSIGFLFLSFLVEIPIMSQYESLRAAFKEEQTERVLFVPGLPGYSLMHAYTLFLPVMCYLFKTTHGRIRAIVLVGLLLLCFVIYETFITTSLVIMVCVIIFTFFYSDKGSLALISTIFIITVILVLLYTNGAFIRLIDRMMPIFEDTAVQEKLIDFRASMIEGHLTGGSIISRVDLHRKSLDSFIKNPIFGSLDTGGHSALLDRLGGIGLLGTFPFVMIFVSFITQMARLYKSRMSKAFFGVGVVIGLVFLYNKGNWGGESWLIYMVLMPFGLLFNDNNEKQRGLREQEKS